MTEKLYGENFGPIEWNIHDPNVPVIVQDFIRAMPGKVVVGGFKGRVGTPGSIPTQSATVYMMILNALTFVKNITHSVPNWSRTEYLVVVPRAGVQFNAYYDGTSLRFFYNTHPSTGQMVYSCDSSDVVSHELGHAILDAWRPDLWSTVSLESMAFHESFGDMMSILAALHHGQMIDFILSETGGDLRKSNALTKVAEQLGSAIYPGATYLRDAFNNFTYVPPESLPNLADNAQLSREAHSYSRLFTGAFYDLLVWLYNEHAKNTDKKNALILARDNAAAALFQGIPRAPNSTRFFESVANAMKMIGDPMIRDGITKAFGDRGIIKKTGLMAMKPRKEESIKKIKINDHLKQKTTHPLGDIEVDIPNENKVISKKRLKMSEPEDIIAAKECLDYLALMQKVSYQGSPDKEFSVVDGKLVRNFIHCCRKS